MPATITKCMRLLKRSLNLTSKSATSISVYFSKRMRLIRVTVSIHNHADLDSEILQWITIINGKFLDRYSKGIILSRK